MYLIDDERVENAIMAADAVCKAPGVYRSPGDYSGHASIDAMLAYVQTKFDIQVHLWDVSFQGTNIGSRLEVYKDRIEISVRSDQDIGWKRFCAAKELMHLLIDSAQDYSPYGNDRIDEMLEKGIIGLASAKNNTTGNPTQSELVAEIGAVEVLYPAKQIIKDIEQLKTEGHDPIISIPKAALIRQMPRFYVATALRQDFRTFVAAAMTQCNGRRENSSK